MKIAEVTYNVDDCYYNGNENGIFQECVVLVVELVVIIIKMELVIQ